MLNDIIKISVDAGNAIMEIYNSADFGVEMKSDDSPLTLADQASHDIIEKSLSEKFPDIPILSEEGKDIPYETRKSWDKFWAIVYLTGQSSIHRLSQELWKPEKNRLP